MICVWVQNIQQKEKKLTPSFLQPVVAHQDFWTPLRHTSQHAAAPMAGMGCNGQSNVEL